MHSISPGQILHGKVGNIFEHRIDYIFLLNDMNFNTLLRTLVYSHKYCMRTYIFANHIKLVISKDI